MYKHTTKFNRSLHLKEDHTLCADFLSPHCLCFFSAMVFLSMDMFDNLSLPICHVASLTQHGLTMSERLKRQRQGGFSTYILKVFKVMRVFFWLLFFYYSKAMVLWNVPDVHRQSHSVRVPGPWLKHWVLNTAELAVSQSRWQCCRDHSPIFITTMLNVVSFFSFFYISHI